MWLFTSKIYQKKIVYQKLTSIKSGNPRLSSLFGDSFQCPLSYPIISDNDLEKCKAKTRNALSEPGRHAEAVVSYDRVIAINPGDAEAWYSRGHAVRCLGRQEEADVSHDKAVALDPGCGAIHGPRHTRKKNPG